MYSVTRELKLALIVGFSLVLVVTVLISDHLSKARNTPLAEVPQNHPALVAVPVVDAGPLVVAPPAPAPTAPAPEPERVIASTTGSGLTPLVRPEPVTVRQGTAEAFAQGPVVSASDDVPGFLVDNSATGRGPTDLVNTVTPQALEKTHTVVDGDSLFKISKQYYGNGTLWKRIAEANPDKVKGESLRIGSKLRIPIDVASVRQAINDPLNGSAGGKRAEPKQSGKKGKFGSYTVKKGDTLNDISRRVLGSSERTDELLKLNEGVLEDEDSVQIGMILKIPLS